MQALRRVIRRRNNLGAASSWRRRRQGHWCSFSTISLLLLLLSDAACCADAGHRQQFRPAATSDWCRSRRTSTVMSVTHPQNHHTVYSHHRGHFSPFFLFFSLERIECGIPAAFSDFCKRSKMALESGVTFAVVKKQTEHNNNNKNIYDKYSMPRSCLLLYRDQ